MQLHLIGVAVPHLRDFVSFFHDLPFFDQQLMVMCIRRQICLVVLDDQQPAVTPEPRSAVNHFAGCGRMYWLAALAGDVFGPRLAPAALGLMTIVFGTGQALGPYLAGIIADVTRSFSPAFVIAGAVALILGAGGSLLLRTSKGGT